MAFSGNQVTQLKVSGQTRAKPAGSFANTEEAEIVVVVDDGAWYPIYKAARIIR